MANFGFIGVGAVGSALTERAIELGHDVIAFDESETAQARIEELGARPARSPAAVAAEVSLISVAVRSEDQCVDVVVGSDGILKGARPGSVIVLHSTIRPEVTVRLAESADAVGARVVDAPIVGVPDMILAGNSTLLVGGTQTDFDEVASQYDRLCREILFMGPLGAGNVSKIIKNLCTAAEALVLAEALAIGEAAGIPYLAALDMMTRVDQYHFIDHWSVAFDDSGATSSPLYLPNLYGKDIPLAGELAHDYELDTPITQQLVSSARQVSERARS